VIKAKKPQTSRIQFQKNKELLAPAIPNITANKIEEADNGALAEVSFLD
jgi:hypothetical protein